MRNRHRVRISFTLVELLVVVALIAVLSTLGITSYASHARENRNAIREAHLLEIAAAVDTFIALKGRAPQCASGIVCYFALDTIIQSEISSSPPGIAPPKQKANGENFSGGNGVGMHIADWPSLEFKAYLEDPLKLYYLYASVGTNKKYAIFATKELGNGYATILKGVPVMERRPEDASKTNSASVNVVADAVLGLGFVVLGEQINKGQIIVATSSAIKFNNYGSLTSSTPGNTIAAVPYSL